MTSPDLNILSSSIQFELKPIFNAQVGGKTVLPYLQTLFTTNYVLLVVKRSKSGNGAE